MENRANITIIGIGKLGLGYALLLEQAGYNVLGVDVSEQYVSSINDKTFRTAEPFYNELLLSSENLRATTSLKEGVEFSDTIFIIVQTPNSGGERFYDHGILSNVLVKINELKPKNKDVVIGCTVMPKYIDQVGKHLLGDCENTYLSYNPEFVAQGDIILGFQKPDIILVGTTSPTLEPKLRVLYKTFVKTEPKYCFLTPIEAETVKLALNSYITTKISFANMISDFCDRVGADKHKVLDSIGSDSRIGNKYFRPGYSYGGPCFPRDTKAMEQLLRQNAIDAGILSATTAYNQSHIQFQVDQLYKENLGEYVFENVCYKENSRIPLIEESAKLKIAKWLVKFGNTVIIYDYEDIIMEVKKEYGNMFEYRVKTEEFSEPIQQKPVQKLAETQEEEESKSIEEVYKFWNDRPCNIRHSDKEIGTREYFEEVTKRKYLVEPHILEFAEFEKYNRKKVLEVGCGIGTAAQSFIENGAIYEGIDLSDYSIELANQRLELFDLWGNVYQQDIETRVAVEDYYDLVYSFGVLHHTPHPEIAIKKIHTMLKPGGEFKLMMYAKHSLKYAEIETGLDQFEAQSGVPIANVYTNEEIHELLKDFNNIRIMQTHIFPYKIEEYKQYKYVKKDYFEAMPEDVFKCLESKAGWHLCITCTK